MSTSVEAPTRIRADRLAPFGKITPGGAPSTRRRKLTLAEYAVVRISSAVARYGRIIRIQHNTCAGLSKTAF
jgi:hypothetical protein